MEEAANTVFAGVEIEKLDKAKPTPSKHELIRFNCVAECG